MYTIQLTCTLVHDGLFFNENSNSASTYLRMRVCTTTHRTRFTCEHTCTQVRNTVEQCFRTRAIQTYYTRCIKTCFVCCAGMCARGINDLIDTGREYPITYTRPCPRANKPVTFVVSCTFARARARRGASRARVCILT